MARPFGHKNACYSGASNDLFIKCSKLLLASATCTLLYSTQFMSRGEVHKNFGPHS